ncbi:MAG: c-type cytochrome [Longimicrobiales bacterium]|nr:c-type cytochrome [Longimicrobiales bacterium]
MAALMPALLAAPLAAPLTVAVLLLLPAGAVAQGVDGAALYDQWCAGCHGVEGDGQGPAANTMLPRPRDFTVGLYQIRTTGTGELPTDEDILRVIDEGMPGTAMPGWEEVLTRAERNALVDYLKSFSRFFATSPEPEPLEFGGAPRATDERVARGREVYDIIDCGRCHGVEGRGDGPSAPTLENDAGYPTIAADLTEAWRFNGGGSVEEIYRRLRSGLDGTPMPSFSDLVEAGVIEADDLWNLAHYIRSLSPAGEEPRVREVITAGWVGDEPLPTAPDDPRWDEADRFWVPLAGQIMVPPRWFNPRVDGLWVQGLHDGEEVALRVSWSDPSRSPDPSWEEWVEKVLTTMTSADAGSATGPGPGDRLTVQFPQQASEGMQRPFFLQGDGRRPAYLWSWTSWVDGPVESIARGLGTDQPQPPDQQDVTVGAVHEAGQWHVLFRRALSTESSEDPPFAVGTAIPMAFQAWDGDNGEEGAQGSVSTWYFLSLQQPTPVVAYGAPALALFLAFGLGLVVVRRAQRKQHA